MSVLLERSRGRVSACAVALLTVLGLLVTVVSPASATGTLSSSLGGVVASTLGTGGGSGQPADAGEEACVRYTRSSYDLVFNSGSVDGTSAAESPINLTVSGDTPDRFEGPSGSYDPNNGAQFPTGDSDGCVKSTAGATELTYNVTALEIAGVGDSTNVGDDLRCVNTSGGAAAGSWVKRSGGVITIFLNDVTCNALTKAGLVTPTDITIEAVLQKTDPPFPTTLPVLNSDRLTVCNSPIAPVLCKIATATAVFS